MTKDDKGFKHVVLNELLSEEQIKEVTDYINNEAFVEGHKATDTEVIDGLKQILSKWKDELEEKGVDSNYLAYVIAYKISKIREERTNENNVKY